MDDDISLIDTFDSRRVTRREGKKNLRKKRKF